jgi:hypothetical protein
MTNWQFTVKKLNLAVEKLNLTVTNWQFTVEKLNLAVEKLTFTLRLTGIIDAKYRPD